MNRFAILSFYFSFSLAAVATLAGCATTEQPATRISFDAAGCSALQGRTIAATDIGTKSNLKSGAAVVDSAAWQAAAPLTIAPAAPVPEARINPATPEFCKVLGHIKPVDPAAPNINFQVNLPKEWNGKYLQHGGGGFNGVLVNGLSLVRGAAFDKPGPLFDGYATAGTDSGHQNKAGVPLQDFAKNEEAFVNFAHASYKKVRDVSVALMQAAYGKAPIYTYFAGSSEGGREALTMAQRYPNDWSGVIARVPVINWTGLMQIGITNGTNAMKTAKDGGGWLDAPDVKLVHDAVLAACDGLDGLADGIVADPVACRAKFDVTALTCQASQTSGCLNAAQIQSVKTLHSPLQYPFPLANGVTQYPGRGPSGENAPTIGVGPTGGWRAWWMGLSPLSIPARPDTRSWDYSVGAISHIYMQKPNATPTEILGFKWQDYKDRVLAVSALMDSTNPDLSAFQAAGGKLILMEYMGDYAQSPYAGIQYFESVERKMGTSSVAAFAKLYAVPNVDHVGSGAPSTADIFTALTQWRERGVEPKNLTLSEYAMSLPLTATRTRPLCEWPLVGRYKGGDMNIASSFICER